MARKKKPEEPGPSAPLWMATYGDMVTLVLSFFILLYSFSAIDNQKFQTLVISLQGSLGVMDGGTTVSPGVVVNAGDQGDKTGKENQQLEEDYQLQKLKKEISEYLETQNLKGQISLSIDERGLLVRFVDTALFDLGKADIKPEARQVLVRVLGVLKTVPNPVRIEGHTDNLAINTYRFPSNWELSTARATTVVRFFINSGFPAERLSAMGYGEHRPIADNSTTVGQQKNRRIDVVLLRDSVARSSEPQQNNSR